MSVWLLYEAAKGFVRSMGIRWPGCAILGHALGCCNKTKVIPRLEDEHLLWEQRVVSSNSIAHLHGVQGVNPSVSEATAKRLFDGLQIRVGQFKPDPGTEGLFLEQR